MHRPLAAYWDPVLKRNRAKRMKLFARLLEIGLLRPRPKGIAKYFQLLILDARIVNWAFVSPPGMNLLFFRRYGSN